MAKTPRKKATRKTASRKSSANRTPRRRRRRSRKQSSGGGVLELAREARAMAGHALEKLRDEIRDVRKHLEKLVTSERDFQMELFGGHRAPQSPRVRRARKTSRRKGPTKADGFLEKLPKSFSLEDVRKIAGRHTGVSLAQWGRSKKVKKVGKGQYKKAA